MVVRPRGPCYDISDLVKDCSARGKVFVRTQAVKDAAKSYSFETQERIIDFVSLGVFEDLKHKNTNNLDLGPNKGALFDAYEFRIGPKWVYFAFYKTPKNKWIIKSFHPPDFGEKASPLFHNPFKVLEGLKK